MNLVFFTIIIVICLFAAIQKPGVVIAYILFYQNLNNIIFNNVGLEEYRYTTTILFIPLVVLLHYKKLRINLSFKHFISSKITYGYFLLIVYIIIYGFYIGTSYEIDYIKLFLFPGLILFMLSGILINKVGIFKEMFYGIIIFSCLIFISIFLFNISRTQDYFVERAIVGEVTGISPITQGRTAGLLIVFSTLVLLYKNRLFKAFGIALLIFSAYWLNLTGTRGALVAVVVTMAFFLFFVRQRKRVIIIFLIFIAVIILVLAYFNFSQNPLLKRTAELFHSDTIESSARFHRYILFFDLLPNNFLFGLGPGGWGKDVMTSLYSFRYPHNIIIELVLNYGLIGAISFLLIFVNAFFISMAVVKDKQSSLYLKAMALAWIFIAVSVMFSGSMIQGNIEIFTFSGLLIGISFLNKKYEPSFLNKKRQVFNKIKINEKKHSIYKAQKIIKKARIF